MAAARKTKSKATVQAGRSRATKKRVGKANGTRSVKTASSKRSGTPVKATPKSTTKPNGKSNGKPSDKENGKPNGKLHSKPVPEKKVRVQSDQKEMLRQERAQVENELANLRAEMQQAPEMTGDEVDLNVYEREKTFGLIAAYERRLEEIDTTLKVAAEGKYGICERCGKAIDPERLKIFPETRLCVTCKNEVEREQRRLRM